ncbi:MAG: ketoacyl-ACP synthase III [Clostridiales Family XIII bacterium]|jgi:3-oxoacyl-[acyl-carrier-protein] synthase-3|nr:ketoacyl-ACP synthase III [Clostridiales Family XIII bacterium]
MKIKTRNVKISGTSAAVPKFTITNHELGDEFFGEKFVSRIEKTVGTKYFHPANPKKVLAEIDILDKPNYFYSSGDLGIIAAKDLIKKLNINVEKIDTIIFNSQTTDFVVPPTAYKIAKTLNIKRDIYIEDTTQSCAGFVLSLMKIFPMIEKGIYKNTLLINAETHMQIVNRKDKEQALIFSDGAAATFIEKSDYENPAFFNLRIAPENYEKISMANFGNISDENTFESGYSYMDGEFVARYIMKNIPEVLKETLSFANITSDNIDSFLFHQANAFMNEFIAKRVHIGKDRLPVNIDKYGNTSSVSIPLLIVDKEKSIFKGDKKKYLLCGYGGGFAIAAAVMDLENLKGEILSV